MKLLSRVMKKFQVNVGIPVIINTEKPKNVIKEDQIELQIDQQEDQQENLHVKLIEDAKREAQQIISDANLSAAQVIQDAKLQAEEMVTVVFEEARRDGYKLGHAEVTEKAEGLLREAENIKATAKREYEAMLDSFEGEMIQLVLDIAKKVIGDELEFRTEAVSSLVGQALLQCKGVAHVVIKVSPEDYEIVLEKKDMIAHKNGFSGELEIKQDLSLAKGDCIIETPMGSIDASVQTQLEAIEEAFNEMLTQKESVSEEWKI